MYKTTQQTVIEVKDLEKEYRIPQKSDGIRGSLKFHTDPGGTGKIPFDHLPFPSACHFCLSDLLCFHQLLSGHLAAG